MKIETPGVRPRTAGIDEYEYSQQFQPMFCMLNGLRTGLTFVTNDSCRRSAIRAPDPIEDTLSCDGHRTIRRSGNIC
jgi:hypothetical protein